MRTLGQFFNLKAKEETSFLFGNINNHLETCYMQHVPCYTFSNVEFKFSDIAFSMPFTLVKFSTKFRKSLYQTRCEKKGLET